MADLVVKNGKIVGPTTIVEANLVVENGKISRITKQDVPADETVDAHGLYVIPGLIDGHVHFREPGDNYKEDWKSGSQAAAAGGVTTVLDMPNNKPSITTIKLLEEKREIAGKKSIVDFGLYFGAENDNLEEIKNLENVAGVKFFLGKSTGDLLFNEENLPGFFKVLKEKGILAACHCEKLGLLEKYKKDSFRYFSDVRPTICEGMSIRDVVRSMHNNRVHICHLTSDMGVKEIVRAKKLNKSFSCEVTPQHLFLSKLDEADVGAYLKMYPPLRSKPDQTALRHALKSGIIDMVSTDHAPHTREEKEQDFDKAPGGVPGVETRLPLVLGMLDLRGLVKTCAQKPAEIFHIKGKGVLAEGYDADFVLLDLNKEYRISNDALFTKCGWSPFDGKSVKGWVEATFVRGKRVFDGEQPIDNGGAEATFG